MQPIDPKTRVEIIRAAYPKPMRICQAADEHKQATGYCVGGALIQFYGMEFDHVMEEQMPVECLRFPGPGLVARAIRRHVPQFSYMDAEIWGERIIENNDKGRFSRAWNYLARALAGEKPRR